MQITGWNQYEQTSTMNQKQESLSWLHMTNECITTREELILCDGILNGKLKSVSDRSYKSEIEARTVGWIVENQASTTSFTGKVEVTGDREEQCSY